MQALRNLNVIIVGNIMLALLSCFVIFHMLILMGVIPFSIVRGGRLENMEQMVIFETVSLTINLIVILMVGIKVEYFKPYLPKKLVNLLLWSFVFLFALNTVGNMFAESKLEMILFTPVTFVSAVFFYRLAIER